MAPKPSASAAPTSSPSASPLSRSKRAAFYAAMVLVPLLLIGGVEGVLRLAGYGKSYPLFVPYEGAPDFQFMSRDVSKRFFYNINCLLYTSPSPRDS